MIPTDVVNLIAGCDSRFPDCRQAGAGMTVRPEEIMRIAIAHALGVISSEPVAIWNIRELRRSEKSPAAAYQKLVGGFSPPRRIEMTR